MSRLTYRHTIAASYLGYITQAIVNNLAPLLFVTFMSEFSLTLEQITMMTTVNFAVQLLVDLLSAKLVDRIGYRVSIVAAHVLAVLGLFGMAILPGILPPMTGLMIAVVLYAIGGGMTEVLISPIVEACPTEGKSAAMSLLHSFYCWGHVALVLLSTLFFVAFGTANWRVLTLLWMIVPIANLEIHFFRGELYHTINCLYFQIAERQIFHSFRFYRNYYIIKFEFCKFLFPYFKQFLDFSFSFRPKRCTL